MVFSFLSCLFVKEIQIKVSACFYEITNCEIPASLLSTTASLLSTSALLLTTTVSLL